jgi:hypothetical protein
MPVASDMMNFTEECANAINYLDSPNGEFKVFGSRLFFATFAQFGSLIRPSYFISFFFLQNQAVWSSTFC